MKDDCNKPLQSSVLPSPFLLLPAGVRPHRQTNSGSNPFFQPFLICFCCFGNPLVFLDSQTKSCFTFPIQWFFCSIYFLNSLHSFILSSTIFVSSLSAHYALGQARPRGPSNWGFLMKERQPPLTPPAPLCFSQKPEHWFSFGSMTFSWDSLLICQQLLLMLFNICII